MMLTLVYLRQLISVVFSAVGNNLQGSMLSLFKRGGLVNRRRSSKAWSPV